MNDRKPLIIDLKNRTISVEGHVIPLRGARYSARVLRNPLQEDSLIELKRIPSERAGFAARFYDALSSVLSERRELDYLTAQLKDHEITVERVGADLFPIFFLRYPNNAYEADVVQGDASEDVRAA
jgi:hypothetical protein